MAKRKKAKKKSKPGIVISKDAPQDSVTNTGPELSETPVIDGEQATAPAIREIATIGDPPAVERTAEVAQTVKPEAHKPMPRSMGDIKTTQRPVVEKEPEPEPIVGPVICAGCKATVSSDTVRACLRCKGSLVFCPTCAKPGSCHKCGKALNK